MDRRHKALAVLVGLTIACIPVIFSATAFARQKPKPEAPKRPVQTAVAVQGDVPVYLDSFGNLAPSNNVNIISQVTGEIKEVNFNEGQDVKKGDMLFTIDKSPFEAQLAKANAALESDVADLNLKKDIVARNKKLAEQQLISQQDFDKYVADAASAEAKIKLDKANIDLAKINLGYCSIASPIDGVTGKRQVDAGNIVTANSGTPLVNIKTVDPLYVDFTLSESNLKHIRESIEEGDLKVQISPQGDDASIYNGSLELISNTVDVATGTISLRAVVPNPKRKLWPGQFVKVRLILGVEKNAVTVPYEAVKLGQKGSYLFVITADNTADLRQVTCGPQVDDDIVIESGVKAGERVVTSGQMGLSPGVCVIEATK